MDDSSTRVLIAASLGRIIEPHLRRTFAPGAVTIAVDEHQVRAAVTENLRFDVVLADLTWNDVEIEYSFDGLDVLDLVHHLGRPAPLVFAAQGHGIEQDHLDEAGVRNGVAGIIRKGNGLDDIVTALRRAATGHPLGTIVAPPSTIAIHQYFGAGRRGETAARMAGAIAARRASNYDTLAAVARCSKNTTTKIADKYLGPLIRERGEHPPDVPLTTQAVYRWCGEHSRYLVSWCRRHGHADVL